MIFQFYRMHEHVSAKDIFNKYLKNYKFITGELKWSVKNQVLAVL